MILEKNAFLIIAAGIILLLWGLLRNRYSGIFVTITNNAYKKLDIAYFVIFSLFCLFAICVTESYDLSNYRFAYDEGISHGKEPLFDAVRFFFRDRGWSFDAFKAIWVIVITLLLYYAIKKYSDTPSKVLALSLITPLTGFITQMRSAMVGAVAISALLMLFHGKGKSRILYIIIIILCAQIHSIGYCFLVFLLIRPHTKMTFKPVYYGAITAVTMIALFFSSSYSQAVNAIIGQIPFLGSGLARVLSYFQSEGSHFRHSLFLICKHMLLFLLTSRACQIQEKRAIFHVEEAQKFRMIKEANTIMLLFLPITILSASFERLFNYFALIQYAMVFNVGKSRVKLTSEVFWPQSIQSLMVMGVIVFYAAEIYFSPDDLIKILNSIRWPL